MIRLPKTVTSKEFLNCYGSIVVCAVLLCLGCSEPDRSPADLARDSVYRSLVGCFKADPALTARYSDQDQGRYHYQGFPRLIEFYLAGPWADSLPLRMRSAPLNDSILYGINDPRKPVVRLLPGDSVLLGMGLGVDDWVELRLANSGDSLHGIAVHAGMAWPRNEVLDTIVLRRIACVLPPNIVPRSEIR